MEEVKTEYTKEEVHLYQDELGFSEKMLFDRFFEILSDEIDVHMDKTGLEFSEERASICGQCFGNRLIPMFEKVKGMCIESEGSEDGLDLAIAYVNNLAEEIVKETVVMVEEQGV